MTANQAKVGEDCFVAAKNQKKAAKVAEVSNVLSLRNFGRGFS